MSVSSEFQAGIEKSVVNMDRLDSFVNGPVDVTVTTDNGPIPTLAEFLQQQADAIGNITIGGVPGLSAALAAKLDTSATTVFGRSLIDDADAPAARTTLGLGSAATQSTAAFAPATHSHAITDVTGLRAELDSLAGGSGATSATAVSITDGASGTKYANVQAYRNYLLANTGATQIGWRRTGTTTDRQLDKVLDGLTVTPEDFGAQSIEDGASASTSQTTALIAALNSGRVVNCQGKTYAIGAPLAPTGSVKGVINGNFQWTPSAMSGQQFMLSIIDKSDLIVRDNSFYLGTVENTGSNNDSSRGGIQITTSNPGVTYSLRNVIERNRVYGNGNGTGIFTRSLGFSKVNYNIVDERYVDGTATNDAQNGIDFSRGYSNECVGNIVNNLMYRVSGTLTRIYSRGIVVVEQTSSVVSHNMISNVDQALDISGGIVSGYPNGNTGLAVNGNVISDVRTWGIKFANCARDSVCVGNSIRNFGWAGIVVSGQSGAWTSGTADKATQRLLIANNYIFDPAGYYSRTDCKGVWILLRAEYPGYPKGIRVLNNTIENTTGNGRLLYGVSISDGDNVLVSGAPVSEVRGNIVNNQTGAPTFGCSPAGITVVTGGSSQSIPNATATAIQWGTDTTDGQGAHSTSSNTELVYAIRSGWYVVSAAVVFASNSSGYRKMSILKNGGSIPGGDYLVPAVNGAETTVSGTCVVYLSAGEYVRVEVYQNSGGSLNVNRPNSQFSLRFIEQM